MNHILLYANGGNLRGKFGHPMDPKKPPGEAARGQFEFKDIQSQTRILAFQTKFGLVLSHGFGGKKENEVSVTEINRGNEERTWFLREVVLLEAKAAKANQGGKR